MAANTFTQWQALPPFGVGAPGAPVQTGGGGYGPGTVGYRDQLDAARSGYYQGPNDYPDGYLSTINTRREDRLKGSGAHQTNTRAFTRGVHKGERIDPSDYFWPTQWQPERGLAAQDAGQRQDIIPSELPNLKMAVMMGARSGNASSPNRHQALRRLAPRYK